MDAPLELQGEALQPDALAIQLLSSSHIPESYIFIRNLDANAKITNIKSSNSKFRAEKREGMNAIGVSATDFERD